MNFLETLNEYCKTVLKIRRWEECGGIYFAPSVTNDAIAAAGGAAIETVHTPFSIQESETAMTQDCLEQMFDKIITDHVIVRLFSATQDGTNVTFSMQKGKLTA